MHGTTMIKKNKNLYYILGTRLINCSLLINGWFNTQRREDNEPRNGDD